MIAEKRGLTTEEIADKLTIPEGDRDKFREMLRNHLRALPENRRFDSIDGKYVAVGVKVRKPPKSKRPKAED